MHLFECDSQFSVAVNVTATNQLFNIVTEDDQVATRILNHMQRHYEGRAQFMPLNRLAPDVPQPPANFGSDVVPIIQLLRYDPKYELAMQQVGDACVRTLASRPC